ncbi:hypothetical protein WMY93_026688 [Mugilogobius chulae]|uniref:Uncharacterized protein n=1 Tax=Mugilogobius chulae TaxID=88201 RepID=A0AAW0NAW6_9GOBI
MWVKCLAQGHNDNPLLSSHCGTFQWSPIQTDSTSPPGTSLISFDAVEIAGLWEQRLGRGREGNDTPSTAGSSSYSKRSAICTIRNPPLSAGPLVTTSVCESGNDTFQNPAGLDWCRLKMAARSKESLSVIQDFRKAERDCERALSQAPA